MIRKERNMIKEKVNEILIGINEDVADYNGENFFEDGLLDSLSFVDLVAEINDAFGIEIPTKFLKQDYFKSTETIVNLIKELSGK